MTFQLILFLKVKKVSTKVFKQKEITLNVIGFSNFTK